MHGTPYVHMVGVWWVVIFVYYSVRSTGNNDYLPPPVGYPTSTGTFIRIPYFTGSDGKPVRDSISSSYCTFSARPPPYLSKWIFAPCGQRLFGSKYLFVTDFGSKFTLHRTNRFEVRTSGKRVRTVFVRFELFSRGSNCFREVRTFLVKFDLFWWGSICR